MYSVLTDIQTSLSVAACIGVAFTQKRPYVKEIAQFVFYEPRGVMIRAIRLVQVKGIFVKNSTGKCLCSDRRGIMYERRTLPSDTKILPLLHIPVNTVVN